MAVWLIFGMMGLLTYLMIRQSVPRSNRVPVLVLWLVMMTPATTWILWMLSFGPTVPMPTIAMLPLLILCPSLYWFLLEWGRPKTEEEAKSEKSPRLTREEILAAIAAKTKELQEQETAKRKVRPIDSDQEAALRECFPWGVYYLQNIDYHPQAILCRGKLRTVPQDAYQTIRDNIEQLFGDRFLVIFQESFKGQPFFALVPNPWAESQQQEKEEPLTRPGMAFALLAMTLFTTWIMGLELQGITTEMLTKEPQLFWGGLAYGLMLILILGSHELGHYFVAKYHDIKVTLPYFIPIPFFLGTLGAYTQRRSPIPDRKSLFDFAISGPWISILFSIPCLLWGLAHSDVIDIPKHTSFLTFATFDPRFSFVISLLCKLALGTKFTVATAIQLHPVAIASYVGLMITALQLMPIGQLDGGHMIHAMFGQRTANIIAQVTRLCLVALSLIEGDFILFAIFAILMPIADQPALNDVTDLDTKRDIFGMITLTFLVLLLLPLPIKVAHWLMI